MIDDLVPPADWPAFDRLSQAMWQIEYGLSHTIAAIDLVRDRRRQGDTIEYYSGNAPEERVWIEFRDQPLRHDNIKHNLQTHIGLTGEQYIPMVRQSVPIAIESLAQLPPETLSQLDAVSGESHWAAHTRLWLNRIAKRYSYSGGEGVPRVDEGFASTISDAMHITTFSPGLIEEWREVQQQIKSRHEQLIACRPVETSPAVHDTTDRAKAASANERMKAELAANLTEVKGLTARQWATRLGYRSASTITDTPTWKELSLLRQTSKAEKAMDRHRKAKPTRR